MNTIKTLATLALVGLLATGCATTPQEQQDNAAKADQLFGKAKVGLVIASIAVSGYNVVCASSLKTSPICAQNIAVIVNKALQGASDGVAAAERVFAAANSTTDQRLAAAQIATSLVNSLTKAVQDYVPAGVAAPSAAFAGS